MSTESEASVESLDHPVDNAPVRTLHHQGLTIEGYSRAAVQTYWRVLEMKLGFDLGGQPWSFMSTPNWFVSHVHLDHMAALPVLVARRRMMKMEPPTIYLPAEAVEGVEMLLRAVQRLDRGRMPANLIGVVARRRDRAFPRTGRQGLCHQAHAPFAGLPGLGAAQEAQARIPRLDRRANPRLAALRRRGIGRDPDSEGRLHGRYRAPGPRRLPRDLQGPDPDRRDDLRRARRARSVIHKFGHTHLDDLIARADRFENEVIIASHFSTRLHPDQIQRIVEKRLPESLQGRLKVWL